MKNQQEKRMLPMTELRVNENESGAVIEGHAAVFDSWSETLGGIFPFVEKVSKGAFKDSIGKDDIRALFNHDPNYVLGRNLAGTLELEEDELGKRHNDQHTERRYIADVYGVHRRERRMEYRQRNGYARLKKGALVRCQSRNFPCIHGNRRGSQGNAGI